MDLLFRHIGRTDWFPVQYRLKKRPAASQWRNASLFDSDLPLRSGSRSLLLLKRPGPAAQPTVYHPEISAVGAAFKRPVSTRGLLNLAFVNDERHRLWPHRNHRGQGDHHKVEHQACPPEAGCLVYPFMFPVLPPVDSLWLAPRTAQVAS